MGEAELAAYRGLSVPMFELLRQRSGIRPADLCIISEIQLARAIDKALQPKPDNPGEAVTFRLLQQRDENGYIPPDGLINAARQMHARRAEYTEGAGVSTNRWTWLGPGNIGGRIRSILIHPTSTNTMWVGSVSGGIWKTTNGGTSWSVVNDFMANLTVSTMAMQPNNSSIMYAGTGEGFYNIDNLRGAGIFKSADGGTTWNQLSSTNNSNFYYVNRLAISPDSSTLLAATGSGIWRSTSSGSSWTQTSTDSAIKDAKFHTTDSTKAVAAGGYGRAYYSTNGGASWTAATGLPSLGWLGRVELVYAPTTPTTVYAGVNQNNGQIWKSTNGGQSYSQVNTGTNYLGTQGWYNNVLWVDPTNANLLVVGGIDLYRSTDRGTTLGAISQWWNSPPSAHADHHAIVNHPGYNGTSNKTVFFGNDGGIYKATDVTTVAGTTGWTELNNTLGITQFYGASGNVSTGVIVGGTQDNGTLRYSGGTETWTTPFGGDGGFTASDPTNSSYYYGEYTTASVHRSSNGGVSAEYINGSYWNGSAWACKSAPYVISESCNSSNANFIAPLVLDPNNANRLLVGAASLWRTNDPRTANTNSTGPAWSTIKSSIDSGNNISAVTIALGHSDIIWVGHNNGQIYKTANGTAASPTWTAIDNNSSPNPLPGRYITRITLDPSNSNIAYVTLGGFSADNIWRTQNGGTAWSQRTGSGGTALPAVPVRSLVIHPARPDWLYAGTEVGVFTSVNAGVSWYLPQDGPANVSVDELFWLRNKLVAATHGRGLFSTTPYFFAYLPLVKK